MVTQRTTETVNADGHEVEVNRYSVTVTATVEGMGCIGSGMPITDGMPAGIAARIGKLAMVPANYAAVKAMLDDINNNEAAQAHRARLDAVAVADASYEAGCNEVDRCMSM